MLTNFPGIWTLGRHGTIVDLHTQSSVRGSCSAQMSTTQMSQCQNVKIPSKLAYYNKQWADVECSEDHMLQDGTTHHVVGIGCSDVEKCWSLTLAGRLISRLKLTSHSLCCLRASCRLTLLAANSRPTNRLYIHKCLITSDNNSKQMPNEMFNI